MATLPDGQVESNTLLQQFHCLSRVPNLGDTCWLNISYLNKERCPMWNFNLYLIRFTAKLDA